MTPAFGCIALFLLPFAAVGALTGYQAVEHALAGDWGQAGFLTIFALTFGGVGIGGMVAAFAARRKLAEPERLEADNPAAPWLWRADWAAGRIEDSNRTTMYAAWAFATFWNLLSFPAAFLGTRAVMREGNLAALFVLLFPAVGVGLLVWAVRSTIRFRKYGISRLDLSTRPGVVGRSLTGAVQTTVPLLPPDGFQVTLTCIRQVTTGAGKSRSTSESILWQEERRTPGQASRDHRGSGAAIPVAFALPRDARPCESDNPNDRVVWRLKVAAEVPGVDYQSTFEVPVFRTEQSEQAPSAEELAAVADPSLSPAAFRQPPESRIQVIVNRRGTEIFFPAARNPGAAIGLTAFLAIWVGAIGAMLVLGAPLLFPVIFGLFGLLLLLGVLELWLRVSRVTAGSGIVTLASGYLVPGGERSYIASEIADVAAKIGMQASARPYYDVVLLRREGKSVTAGRSVRDKREAEWLAATLKRALGKE